MPPRTHTSGGKTRKVLIGAATVLIVAVVAFGIYWIYIRKAPPAKDAGNLQVTTLHPSTASSKTGAITASTKHYISANFGVEFDYPTDWTVSGDTPGSNELVVTSPELKLKPLSGSSFNGQVLFTISTKQEPLPEFDKGNAVAVLASQKVTYKNPSADQRAQTYISFLRYAGMQPGTLEGIYITGNVGYQFAQAIPEADLTPVDPVVRILFEQCGTKGCNTSNTQVGIDPSMWSESSFSGPLKSLLTSLVVD